MPRVYISSVIDAPAAKVWERVRDFNGLPRWHPRSATAGSRMASRPTRSAAFATSTFRTATASARSCWGCDYDMFCTYSILESPMPLTDYIATLRLTPITDGNRTFAEWTAEFECEEAEAEGLVNGIGTDVFQAGFAALQRNLGR
jgi:hypothetical protein